MPYYNFSSIRVPTLKEEFEGAQKDFIVELLRAERQNYKELIGALRGLVLPHLMQSDSTSQSIADVTKAQLVTFDTDVHHSEITRTSSSRFTIALQASYLIAISVICDTAVANKQIEIWLRVNGVDVANSNTIIKMPGSAETTLAVTFIQYFNAGDYFEFWMNGDNTACQIKATAAGTTPTRPACPSIIMTCSYTGLD